MKSASLYLRGTRIIVHPWSKTSTGVLIGTEPFTSLRRDGPPEELGKAILCALESVQEGLPHPSDWSEIDKPLLDASGVKSWSAFVKSAIGALVLESENGIQFVPQENRGPRDGFQDVGIERVKIHKQSGYKAIGEAAVRALERSR